MGLFGTATLKSYFHGVCHTDESAEIGGLLRSRIVMRSNEETDLSLFVDTNRKLGAEQQKRTS